VARIIGAEPQNLRRFGRFPLPSNAFNSARDFVVAGLPREDKEMLLHELARECGYLLEPAIKHVSEDFQRKLFVDNND
jgi:hypothetical protein